MKLNKLNIAVAALAAVALAGCKNEDLSRQHYDNKLFISATNFTDEMLIKAANPSYEREITAGSPSPSGRTFRSSSPRLPNCSTTTARPSTTRT